MKDMMAVSTLFYQHDIYHECEVESHFGLELLGFSLKYIACPGAYCLGLSLDAWVSFPLSSLSV